MPTLFSRVLFVLILFLAVCAPCAAQAPPSCTTNVLQTPLGWICGIRASVTVPGKAPAVTVSEFLGIPYAQPPVRWKNPVALSIPAWSGTYKAIQLGSICAQNSTPAAVNCSFTGSEDCLFLNIYVPGNATAGSNLPVMVFIHGGAFVSGAGSDYDGSQLAASGNVIVVTFNYRLGPLGFLALAGTDASNSNVGFRDQIMALQWVKSYISSFGGDAANVTIFGESAGAMSVGLHALVSPPSRGLFQNALMESNLLGLPYKSLSEAEAFGAELSTSVGCAGSSNPASCMGQQSAQGLVCAQVGSSMSIFLAGLRAGLVWAPAIDNSVITGQPMVSAGAGGLTVPMVLGTNLNEGTLFAVLSEQQAQAAQKPFGSPAYTGFIKSMFGPNAPGALTRYPCLTADCTQPLSRLLTDYLFTCANRNLAKTATARTSSRNLYLYQFARVPPQGCNVRPNISECASQVCHGQELIYVFDQPQNVQGGGCAFGTTNPGDQTLSNDIAAYWSNLAIGRTPNASGLFGWPAFAPSGSYLVLDQNLSTAHVVATDSKCDFWDRVGYDLTTWFSTPQTRSLKGKK